MSLSAVVLQFPFTEQTFSSVLVHKVSLMKNVVQCPDLNLYGHLWDELEVDME